MESYQGRMSLSGSNRPGTSEALTQTHQSMEPTDARAEYEEVDRVLARARYRRVEARSGWPFTPLSEDPPLSALEDDRLYNVDASSEEPYQIGLSRPHRATIYSLTDTTRRGEVLRGDTATSFYPVFRDPTNQMYSTLIFTGSMKEVAEAAGVVQNWSANFEPITSRVLMMDPGDQFDQAMWETLGWDVISTDQSNIVVPRR